MNSGTNTADWLKTCPSGGGALTAIAQTVSPPTTATVCLGAGADPVAAWIYQDLSKVFVLDFSLDQVYVFNVNAGTLKVTNTIALPAGSGPFKVAQSNDGLFIYVLNSNRTISIINGQLETLAGNPLGTPVPTDNVLTSAAPVDIAQDTNFNDTSANTQVNHVWILHADGTVSVFDGTTPGQLSWITSLATGANPTNLALLRDGTWAYVGLGGTDQIVGIDTSKLNRGAATLNATTSITVGVNRTVSAPGLSCNVATGVGCLEVTTPTVNSIAVSRQGNSADLSKVYAATATNTTYYYYDAGGNPTSARPADDPTPAWCTDNGNATRCLNLYNGTSIVAAANINGGAPGLNHPINTLITTLPAPSVVPKCDPGNPYDGQKNCPAMVPVMVLGRS